MNKELKVGVIAIISLAVLYVGVNYLKGFNVLNESRFYYAKYDNIGGLTSGSSVFLNGYQVGMVSDINLLNHENQQLLITINIDQDFDIQKKLYQYYFFCYLQIHLVLFFPLKSVVNLKYWDPFYLPA